MATTVQPTMDIIHTDTIASANSVTITMPGGANAWYITSIQAVGDGTTELAVADTTPTTFLNATAVPAAGLTAVSAAPDTSVAGTVTLTASGGGTGVTFVKLVISSDNGVPLAVS